MALNATDTINGREALKNYVGEVTANFFYPRHKDLDINTLQSDIFRKIDRDCNLGYFSNYYNQEHVYQATLDESINFITDKARLLKGEKGENFIRKEIINRISHISEIPFGFFSQYIGTQLKEKLAHIDKQKPTTPEKYYPSTECCICYNDFDSNTEQVFLAPCGHDLCKEYCREHFFNHRNNHCPQCRAKVDKGRLKKIVFAPSAPASSE